MLERSEFEEIIDIVIQHKPERLLLLQWLPRTVVSTLRETSSYRDQVTMDLLFLNENPRLRDTPESPLVTWLTNAARVLQVFPRSERILAIRDRIRPLLEDNLAAPAAALTPDITLATLADALARAWGKSSFPTEKTPRPGWNHIRARTDDANGAVNFGMGGGPDGCPIPTTLDGPLREPRSSEAGAYAFFKVRLRPATREARVEIHTLIVDYGAGKGSPETRKARVALASRLATAKMPSGWKKGGNFGQGTPEKKSGMVWCYKDWDDFDTLEALAAQVRALVDAARPALVAAARG